jgi:enamine deaminase RidA (YjgF/YER057c/UK114 family)
MTPSNSAGAITHDIGVAAHIGAYSDAVEVPAIARWLAVSGTPGLDAEGRLPSSFAEQADQAWRNISRALAIAGFDVGDLVKITQYLTSAEDIAAYAEIRARFLNPARPASTLLIVPALVWPGMRIEIEAWAARQHDQPSHAVN